MPLHRFRGAPGAAQRHLDGGGTPRGDRRLVRAGEHGRVAGRGRDRAGRLLLPLRRGLTGINGRSPRQRGARRLRADPTRAGRWSARSPLEWPPARRRSMRRRAARRWRPAGPRCRPAKHRQSTPPGPVAARIIVLHYASPQLSPRVTAPRIMYSKETINSNIIQYRSMRCWSRYINSLILPPSARR
jgi:hypothetical protein